MIGLMSKEFNSVYKELSVLNEEANIVFSDNLHYDKNTLSEHIEELSGKSGIYYIYKKVGKDEHGYVGQAVDLYARLNAHLNKAAHSETDTHRDSPALHNALKTDSNEFYFKILAFTTNLNEAEKNWIAKKHTFVLDPAYTGGYNLTPGGQDNAGLARRTSVVQYDFYPSSPDLCDLQKPLAMYITCVAAARALFGDDYTDTKANNIRAAANEKTTKYKDRTGNYIKSKPQVTAYGYHWKRFDSLPDDIKKLALEKIAD